MTEQEQGQGQGIYRTCPKCSRLEHKDEPTCRVCGATMTAQRPGRKGAVMAGRGKGRAMLNDCPCGDTTCPSGFGLPCSTVAQGSDLYDRKFAEYDREQCESCGRWIPWPAMDDHDCRAFYGTLPTTSERDDEPFDTSRQTPPRARSFDEIQGEGR